MFRDTTLTIMERRGWLGEFWVLARCAQMMDGNCHTFSSCVMLAFLKMSANTAKSMTGCVVGAPVEIFVGFGVGNGVAVVCRRRSVGRSVGAFEAFFFFRRCSFFFFFFNSR